MLKLPANRDVFVKALAVLCIALVGVMGTVQATHSHADDSTASHHTCTICATAHAGVSTAPATSTPVLTATKLAIFVAEVSPVFRPVTARFIRPPPAF